MDSRHFTFADGEPHQVEDEDGSVIAGQTFYLNGYELERAFEDVYFHVVLDDDGLGFTVGIDPDDQDYCEQYNLDKLFKRLGDAVNRSAELLLSKDDGDIASLVVIGKVYEPVQGVVGKAISLGELANEIREKLGTPPKVKL